MEQSGLTLKSTYHFQSCLKVRWIFTHVSRDNVLEMPLLVFFLIQDGKEPVADLVDFRAGLDRDLPDWLWLCVIITGCVFRNGVLVHRFRPVLLPATVNLCR